MAWSRLTIIGGTGYAGSVIAARAAQRGGDVTVLSSRPPSTPIAAVTYVQGDATDVDTVASVITGAHVVVAALAPRGPLSSRFREVNRTIAELCDVGSTRLAIVGGYSSLRPAAGAPQFVEDLSHVPIGVRDEVLAGAALIIEDLPLTPHSLDYLFVSPALGFGSHAPQVPLGRYELGGEVAVEPVTGGVIAAEDYALGMLDLIDGDDYHRVQVNLGNPA